jgi:DNA-binding GntR family transcriptional regulator
MRRQVTRRARARLFEPGSPASDAIADAIRFSIVSGELGPGHRLKEDQFANEFGVSRVPVREAIKRLDAEGYITVTVNAGARVSVPSARDASELLQIRSALEVLAARLAAQRRATDQLEKLRDLLGAGEAAVKAGDFTRLPELSAEFHGCLIEASGNAHLIRSLAEVRAKLAWIWAVDVEHRPRTSWAAHKEIFGVVARRDAERAATAIAAHLSVDELEPGQEHDTTC